MLGAAGKDCIQPKARGADVSLPSNNLLQQQEVKVAFDGDFGIAYGEMLAIKITIDAALEARLSSDIIVLATDNMSCKYWIEKGHARDERIQDLLNEIHSILSGTGKVCRLFVTYVNTLDNFADEISRNKATKNEKIDKNHALLKRALDEATASLWNLGGGRYGGATRE